MGKRSVAKEEGASARNTEEDDEPDLLKLSPVGEVLRRASEAGSGVLSVGRCARRTGWSPPGITRTYHGHDTQYACEPVPQRQAAQRLAAPLLHARRRRLSAVGSTRRGVLGVT